MTKAEIIRKLGSLTNEEFERVAPFLEADLDAVDDLAALHREIKAGRKSSKSQPILESKDVYARARKALSK